MGTKLTLVAVLMTACGTDDPLAPRDVSAFDGKITVLAGESCVIDLTGVEYATLSNDPEMHPLGFNGDIGGPTGERQDGDRWLIEPIGEWTGDPGNRGMAFYIGGVFDIETGEGVPESLVWARCE